MLLKFDKLSKEEIGRWLRDKREEAGYSREELQKKLDIKTSGIIKSWEEGRSAPSTPNVVNFVKVLGIEHEEFEEVSRKAFESHVIRMLEMTK